MYHVGCVMCCWLCHVSCLLCHVSCWLCHVLLAVSCVVLAVSCVVLAVSCVVLAVMYHVIQSVVLYRVTSLSLTILGHSHSLGTVSWSVSREIYFKSL